MSHKEHAFPASGAWLLDNPIRKLIQPPSELIQKIGITQDQTVVDFGCGPGYFTVELAKKAGKVIAIDLSVEMLKKVQLKVAKAHITNVEFLQSNGTNIQLEDGSVDMILLVTVFHEIGNTATVLKEFAKVLKPNGRLIIMEVIKKGIVPGAPIQNPKTIETEVTATNFKVQQILPYKNYGIFFFSKNT